MSEFKLKELREIIDFNPYEKLAKNVVAKKIPMESLKVFQKKIDGYNLAEYKAGPKFKNGDVLLAKITPCLENGKTAYVDILNENEVAFGSSEFIVMRTKENSNPEYLYYLARSPAFRKKAIGCMEGTSGRKRVNESVLKLYKLPIPEKKDQKKIAAVLSALDDKIELNNRINAELEKMAKTLYDYWFVQFDFPDAGGKPYKSFVGKMVYNKTLKREIPEGWEVKCLDNFVNIKKGKLITEKTANLNGSIKVVSAGLDFSYYHSDFNREKNTITISASGANAGFINFWREPIFACDCTTVNGDSDVETLFTLYYLKHMQNYIYKQARGSAQPHVYPKDIGSLSIPLPKQYLLDKYKGFIINWNDKIALNQKQNQQLTTLRDFLLPMLMNGQVRVT